MAAPSPRARPGLAPGRSGRVLRGLLLALLVGSAALAVVLARTSGGPAWTLGAAVVVCYAALSAVPLWLATDRLTSDLVGATAADAAVVTPPVGALPRSGQLAG